MTVYRLLDGFESLQSAQTRDQLLPEMERFAKRLGFDRYVYAMKIDASPLAPARNLLSGCPQAWVTRYVSRGFFSIDPIIRACERSHLPVLWDEHMHVEDGAHEFWDEARSFGLCAGISFTACEQAGVTGIFSLARDQPLDFDEEALTAIIGRAHVFAGVLHRSMCRIALPLSDPRSPLPLTARERECVRWAANGKTSWETGQILGITERTAIFHINNAILKLGAANKTQAIVRAVSLNLL